MKTKTENANFTYIRPIERCGPLRGLKILLCILFFSVYVRIAPPAAVRDRKYHISVCQIFKDEAPYLKEWIEYHLMMGIDHFYFYDNNSSDGCERVLQPYIDQGVVTLTRWPHEHAQVAAYEDCIRRFRDESDWIGFLDVDEFVVPVAAESFPAFLDGFSHRPAVLLYWRFFGSGGMMDRDVSRLVTEDFVVASEKLYSKGKCFYNTNYDYLWNSARNKSMFHMFWTSVHGVPVPAVDMFDRFTLNYYYYSGKKEIPVQINHYAVKSLKEHREKNKKGDVYYDKPKHGDSVFYGRDQRCSVPDYRIYKYLTQLKERLHML